MEMPNLFDLMRSPVSDEVNEITTDLNVLALNATIKALKTGNEAVDPDSKLPKQFAQAK